MCEACSNACPVSAISFHTDENGFEYPAINKDRCIECGLCQKVCMTRNGVSFHGVLDAKAVVLKDIDNLLKSSSGGLFFGLAKQIIDENGVVFGAKTEIDEDGLRVVHDKAERVIDLASLQGSKYSRSDIGSSYKEAEVFLKGGKKVLFTGTPCQIAGLYNYLGKDYENLITADVVCHGVPEQKLFRDYLDFLGEQKNGRVVEFCFRDKKYGWGHICGEYVVEKKNGKRKKYKHPSMLSSYHSLYLKGYTIRENCYECLFAQGDRVSDITMGDYWGIHKIHSSFLREYKIEPKRGVSCLLLNTTKGKNLFEKVKKQFYIMNSTIEQVRKNNGRLNTPTEKKADNPYIKQKTYKSKDRLFWKNNSRMRLKRKYLKKRIKMMIPQYLKSKIKRSGNK